MRDLPVDPWSYLALIRQLKLESGDGGSIDFQATPASNAARQPRSPEPTSPVLTPRRLQPRDLDGMIVL